MTQKKLEQLTVKWQKRLRIQDWEIEVYLVDHLKMPDLMGHCANKPSLMCATIKVADDVPEDEMEQTLLHELLHVRFPLSNRDSVDDLMFEQGIEQTAWALMEAYDGR